MANDLNNFARRIKVRAGKVNKNTDTLMKKVILGVDQALVLATPVDTGRARANWRASIGADILETLPQPASPSAGAASAIKAGQDVALAYNGDGSPIVHISNNLNYMKYLNEGSSQQAPANFVNQALLLVAQIIGRGRITVG